MLGVKVKVHHSQYGNGTIVHEQVNSEFVKVDFYGKLKTCRKKDVVVGWKNGYKRPLTTVEAIEELEKELVRNHVAIATLGMLRKKLGL